MRRDITVVAEPRQGRGKNEARRTRKRGMIPAVLYGAKQETVPLSVNPKDVSGVLRSKSGHNTIFDLAVNAGENTPVMVVDWQADPIRGTLLHADFQRIDLTKRIRISVPVVTQGEAKGIKLQGGLLEVVSREIDIECVPDEIPEEFRVDVTELMIGQSKRASDLPMTGSMKLLSPPDAVIAHVVALRAAEAEAVAPAEPEAVVAGSEPEVIKKGKKEEEGADAKSEGKGKGEKKK